MNRLIVIVTYILVISICSIGMVWPNYSYGLGYYGTHSRSFGHHSGHLYSSLYKHHEYRSHQHTYHLYKYHNYGLHRNGHQRYYYNGYNDPGTYNVQTNHKHHYAGKEETYTHIDNDDEPYVFVYGKEYESCPDAYVFKYGPK